MIVGNIILFIIYVVLIVLTAKYMLCFCVRRICGLLNLNNKKIGKVLGYLTSMPELIATIFIAYQGLMLTVSFNLLFSNIINVVLAIIVTVAFSRGKYLNYKKYKVEFLLVIVSILIPVLLLLFNLYSNIWMALIFVVMYGYYVVNASKFNLEPEEDLFIQFSFKNHSKNKQIQIFAYEAIIVIGVIVLYFLGDGLGEVVYLLGTYYMVPEIVIGVVVAIITSMPEMTAFIESYINNRGLLKSHGVDEVVNNVLSSNVANLLLIQTIGIVIFNVFNQ